MIKKAVKSIFLLIRYYTQRNSQRLWIDPKYTFQVIGETDKSVFSGYYDLIPIRGEKHLVHCLPVNPTVGQTKIDIGYYDTKTNELNTLTTSNAWSFQQGSRLRWGKGDYIYLNDYDGEKYVTRKYSLTLNCDEKLYGRPMYDIAPNEQYGVSVNFDRLQCLRPGYGYSNRKGYDLANDNLAEDGLIYYDMKTDETKVLVSLETLGKDIPYAIYINHVSISPDSEKIMYFLLWEEGGRRKSKLYVYHLLEQRNQLIEDSDLVSHYSWRNNDTLIITCVSGNKIEYRVYNIRTNSYYTLLQERLNTDGHPTYIDETMFVSDTYPIKGIQHLYTFDTGTNAYKLIGKMYSNPLLSGEQRCDLHPKVCDNVISIDSTCYGKRRCIVIIGRGDKKA